VFLSPPYRPALDNRRPCDCPQRLRPTARFGVALRGPGSAVPVCNSGGNVPPDLDKCEANHDKDGDDDDDGDHHHKGGDHHDKEKGKDGKDKDKGHKENERKDKPRE